MTNPLCGRAIAKKIIELIENHIAWEKWPRDCRAYLAVAAIPPATLKKNCHRYSDLDYAAAKLTRRVFGSRTIEPPSFVYDEYRAIPEQELDKFKRASDEICKEIISTLKLPVFHPPQ